MSMHKGQMHGWSLLGKIVSAFSQGSNVHGAVYDYQLKAIHSGDVYYSTGKYQVQWRYLKLNLRCDVV